MQNAAARLILGIENFSHITPVLYELHWLPVSLRIDYKILLLTFKCIYGLALTYLSDLISIKWNSLYNLRSTGMLLLDHPKLRMLTTLGARSFSAAAPKFWNGLPVELREATSLNSFKSRLKTYPFKKYFYSSGLSLRFQVAGYLLLVAGEVASSHGALSPPTSPRRF